MSSTKACALVLGLLVCTASYAVQVTVEVFRNTVTQTLKSASASQLQADCNHYLSDLVWKALLPGEYVVSGGLYLIASGGAVNTPQLPWETYVCSYVKYVPVPPSPPPATELPPAPETIGITTCPTGFAMVGPKGGRATYCISAVAEAATGFFAAANSCAGKDTGNHGYPWLCSAAEWNTACTKGVISATGAEWIDSLYYDHAYGTRGAALVGPSCNSHAAGASVGANVKYRCCFR